MTTYKTGNKLGSAAAKDLFDNAENLDKAVNSSDEIWVDRLGIPRRTLVGIDRDANRAMLAYGYITKKSFELGNTLSNPNEVLLRESDGEYYRWDGSQPKVVPAGSTPETTGGVGDGAWKGVGDATLRSALGSPDGSTLVYDLIEATGAIKRTVNNKLSDIVMVTDFGAKGDFDPATKAGTDDTTAFRNAIAAAVEKGYKRVLVPSGNYLIKNELNLSGVGASNPNGVELVGEAWVKSTIWFKAASSDSVLISLLDGSAYTGGKAVRNLSICAHPDTEGMGYGIQLKGCCFVPVHDCVIENLNVGLHLYNASNAGTFTEFNHFHNLRIINNNINIFFERNGGDASYHANNFFNIQNQIKHNGGIGVKVKAASGTCYLYNQFWYMNFFGGPGCTAFDLEGCNTGGLHGAFTAEGALIFKANENSNWQFQGPFSTLDSVVWDVPIEIAQLFGRFVFTNRASKAGTAFTNATMSSYNVLPYVQDLAGRSNNGTFPAIFRVSGANIESIGFANYNFSGNDFFFGDVSSRASLKEFNYRFRLLKNGNGINTAWTSYTITLASNGVSFGPSSITPLLDNTSSLGSSSLRYTTVYATNSAINTSDATKKTEPRDATVEELNAFYLISKLPSVWQWLERYKEEGDAARLHSGPTVQDAIAVMDAHGLEWTRYSCFCYDEWPAKEQIIETWEDKYDEEGNIIVHAGSEVVQEACDSGSAYSFRKEELLLWITRAQSAKMDDITSRLEAIEQAEK